MSDAQDMLNIPMDQLGEVEPPKQVARDPAETGEAPEPRLSALGRGLKGAAITATDAATFGAGRPIAGGINVISDFMTDPVNYTAEDIPGSYRQGYDDQHEYLRQQRETAGPVALTAEVAGGMVGPGAVADTLISGATRPLQKTMMDRLRNYATTSAVAYPEAVLDHYVRGDMGLDEAMEAGLGDLAFGMGAQALVGDVGVPLLKRLTRRVLGYNPKAFAVGSVMQGAQGGGENTLQGLYELSKNVEPGSTLFEQLDDNVDAVTRFHNTLFDLQMGRERPSGSMTIADAQLGKRVQATLDEVTTLSANANRRAASRIDAALAADEPAFMRPRTAEQTQAASMFDEISREWYPEGHPKAGQPTKGATSIETLEVREGASQALSEAFGTKFSEQQGAPRDVWNEFNHLLRTPTEETLGGAVKRLPVLRTSLLAGDPTPSVRDDFFENMSVARLYQVRKEMSAMRSPMATDSNGKLLNPQHRKAVNTLIGYLDDEIASKVGDDFGVANALWSSEMRKQDASVLGEQFYYQSKLRPDLNDDTAAAFERAKGGTLQDLKAAMSADEWAEFQNGFKRGMRDEMENNSPIRELNELFDGYGNRNILTEKSGRIGDAELVLGADAVQDLWRAYDKDNLEIDTTNALGDLIGKKAASPSQQPRDAAGVDRPSGPRGEAVAWLLENPEDIMLSGVLSYMRRYSLGQDANRVNAMLRLATAKDAQLEKLLRKGAKGLVPSGVQIGASSTALATQLFNQEEEPLIGEDLEQALQDQINSLSGE